MPGRRADLNLFAVFAALAREGSVTRAADSLGLSQPAVSHALDRLRHLYKDQLFTRTRGGMEPTPRAKALAGIIHEATALLEGTLEPDRFDPATSSERFEIAMNNYGAIVLAAPLAATVATRAPGVRLSIRPSGTLDLDMLLKRGAIDLAVGPSAPGLDRDDRLLSDRYVVVMRRGHPLVRARLGVESFAAASHLKITSTVEDTGFVDQALRRHGLSRTIRLEVPYIATADAIEASDMVAVMARRIARSLCRAAGLIAKPLPIESPPIEIGMAWPTMSTQRAAHRWLRATLRDVAAQVGR